MNSNKINDHLLITMFKDVGYDVSSAKECYKIAKQLGDEWYTKHTWTQAEQDNFCLKAKDYIKKNSVWNNKKIENEVSWWVFNYGWKCEEKV